ncbi:DUF3006 domain-containing protein [Haloparvum sp. PAK95]|uniref:DUF3006 domain-containing protein n=1 Tax=Haloparvum sp. PAK95 TaxID=3418962 RepID=UPI003D2F0F71
MVTDGTYTAVLDRFESEQAVLVLERDGEDVAEIAVDRERLPAPGRHQDAVYELAVDDGDVVDLDYDPDATSERTERAQDRFDRLSERPPGRDPDEPAE